MEKPRNRHAKTMLIRIPGSEAQVVSILRGIISNSKTLPSRYGQREPAHVDHQFD